MKFKQQGMTLVEVLIAGIILFVSISVISLVSRTKTLNEQKLINAVRHAYLAEYSQATIKYHLKYTQEREGVIYVAGIKYLWTSKVIETKPYIMTINDGNEDVSDNNSLLTLYNIALLREGSDKPIYKFTQLVWGRT